MANVHLMLPRDLAIAKETVICYEAPDTDEALTLYVSKAGGAYNTSASTIDLVDGLMFKLTVGTTDVDAAGDVAWKLVGSGNTTYIYGMRVVYHDPVADVRIMRQVLAGKIIVDSGDGTIAIYASDGVTLLLTLERTEVGDTITWTPV